MSRAFASPLILAWIAVLTTFAPIAWAQTAPTYFDESFEFSSSHERALVVIEPWKAADFVSLYFREVDLEANRFVGALIEFPIQLPGRQWLAQDADSPTRLYAKLLKPGTYAMVGYNRRNFGPSCLFNMASVLRFSAGAVSLINVGAFFSQQTYKVVGDTEALSVFHSAPWTGRSNNPNFFRNRVQRILDSYSKIDAELLIMPLADVIRFDAALITADETRVPLSAWGRPEGYETGRAIKCPSSVDFKNFGARELAWASLFEARSWARSPRLIDRLFSDDPGVDVFLADWKSSSVTKSSADEVRRLSELIDAMAYSKEPKLTFEQSVQ